MKKERVFSKERYLGLDELVRYLGVDKKTIIDKFKKGEVKMTQEGQDLFCPIENLEEFTRAFVSSSEISSITQKMIDDYGPLFARLS